MSIELKAASFTYPDGTAAVENVTLTIDAGERVAIVGQNGAGKTTTVKLMSGLLKPTAGVVTIDGNPTAHQTAAQVARTVGYVFQNPDDQLFGSDVQDELEYMPKYRHWSREERIERVRRAAVLTGIGKLMAINPHDLPFAIRKFVAIGAILVGKCRYIILDEPTAGVDGRGMRLLHRLLDQLRDDGIAVITITHDMRFVAEVFPRVVVLAGQRVIADGTAREVFSDDGVLREAHLKRPVAAQLARGLALGGQAMTVDEVVAQIP